MENGIELANISNLKRKESLVEIVQRLRVLAANRSISSCSLNIFIEEAIKKSISFNDRISLICLYDLQIRQLYNHINNLPEIEELIVKMESLSQSTEFSEGQTLAHQIKWHVEKLKGNNKESSNAILAAMNLIEQGDILDKYTLFGCKYSYAIEIWLQNHDQQSARLLEECVSFFFQEGYYRSLAQTFGLLSVIYARSHECKRVLNISNVILANRSLFENLPLDVKGITYYFTGLGHMLDANLAIANSYFTEAYYILKPIYKESIYFAYYLVLLSYIATIRGLQGKTEQATDMVREADKLLQTEFIKKNLDENSKKQITHTHNIIKFYNLSRLDNYNPKVSQKLNGEIIENCKDLYSDFMTFSEFILNSNLDSDKLQSLLEIDNFSINRVKHLIKFMLEKQRLETEISQEQRVLNCISILESRVITSKTTFMESVYTDLLIAQQLFTLKRYAEIFPLLKQYEKRLNRIEVLEMRIFMEAFIQVGAHESGDPLGPALQYMAIKKCRLYGFSRLENTLLKYLQLQHKEITKAI
ncbi:MAG: hypothetical protein ACTSVO_00645 [Candidatus Heimdallarchaeaceae archaeon]